MKPSARLSLIDVSNKLENLLIRNSAEWKPNSLKELMLKVICLSKASAGFGYLETWEWTILSEKLLMQTGDEIPLSKLDRFAENGRRSVEWGIGMVRANYDDVVKLYAGFEPLANGFIDDRVRSSILLQLGESVSALGDVFSAEAGFSNKVLNIPNQSSIRGLNSGYAMGELVVTNQSPDELEISGDKIYVFNRPPSDLKPVAGIATVTEGNMVSHVQLLARNLGIPNAVVSGENLNSLLAYNGKKVFYAVSMNGTVIIKLATEMSEMEKALFSKKARSEEKISVPVEKMELDNVKVLNLRTVDASSSGKICGPKAANLGQLKKLFPEHVVEGIVIPFSIFRDHFNQQMPGQGKSFWQFLNDVFKDADAMRKADKTDAEVETFVLGRLDLLQNAIKKMPLNAAFQAELKAKFKEAFGRELGQVPVFLRSDTNMEDLKDFTGAGLNLTLFNVLDADKILQGIKDVWASPYTDRSYKWRQKYLLNPENVFPSILIIPSVNADYSGVLITKGVATGKSTDITVAFNRGVGGAVEGQASETWLINEEGYTLISPAREPEFTTIPATGGTTKLHTGFTDRLLSDTLLLALQNQAKSLNERLPATGLKGPYDVELGFKNDKIWLFQVRPFVENKRAAASEYLRSISPEADGTKMVNLNSKP
jgi:phosphoenolpyruvate synthase/pyruvate phosphate dikinase